MGWKHLPKEKRKTLIEEVRNNISVVAYAQTQGIPLKKAGSYFVGADESCNSLVLDPRRNAFWWNSRDVSGNVINLMMYCENKTFSEAMESLTEMLHGRTVEHAQMQYHTPEPEQPAKFVLPKQDTTNKNIFAYLLKTRGLDEEIVRDLVANHNLYQSDHKNCVFVSYDKSGKPVFANQRGTNTDKRFVADVEGSDYNHGLFFSYGGQKLIVAESAIDMLSVATIIKRQGHNWKDYDYLALSGAGKIRPVLHHTENRQYSDVIIAFDFDNAGIRHAHKLLEQLEETGNVKSVNIRLPVLAKDWNEQLLLVKEQWQFEDAIVESVIGHAPDHCDPKTFYDGIVDDEPTLKEELSSPPVDHGIPCSEQEQEAAIPEENQER